MRRWRVLLFSTAIAAAIAILIVFGLSSSRSASVGRKAPALPSERLAGAPATLAQLLASAHGRATLITFWASWCGPCAREAPALERFSQSAAGHGRLVGVDWSDGLSGAREFVARHGWTFPVLRDAEGTVGNDYRLTGLPTTFVLDASGRIRDVLRGPQTPSTLTRAIASVKPS
ncbi:MAG TPA: TlpA disulfide reductase family protein [Solirubrobacteraceae bacterium]|nr:TlpA disulfide reductase family protein [Solirubrobacteraceae bacterium]